MIPGLPQDLLSGGDEESGIRMKRMIYITDSMTAAELDSDGSLFIKTSKDGKPVRLTGRVLRVAKGSGTSVREVEELLVQYRVMANMAKQAGGKKGWWVFLGRCQGILVLKSHSKASSCPKDASCCWRQGSWRWRHAFTRSDTSNAGQQSCFYL